MHVIHIHIIKNVHLVQRPIGEFCIGKLLLFFVIFTLHT